MAIVEIYIKNFKMGGSVVSTSTLLQSVPLSMTDHNLIDPKVKAEMGKAPSLEFAMDVDHPYYDALLQMKTLMRVVFAGETIFRGRVLTIDVDMMGRKQVHCEGDFAFLMDTPQDGSEEKDRVLATVSVYLQRLINKHNSMCGDDDHKFILGEYPNHYSSSVLHEQQIIPAAEQAKQKFGNSSWNTTMDRFEDVLNTFGGYWRTRYVDETHIYLDWFDLYFRPYDESRQRIEVANNLIDFSGSNELENIFTAVIPIGKQDNKELFLNEYWPSVSSGHAKVNYVLVPEIANLGIFSDEELNKGYHTKEDYQNAINNFGMIYKTVTFENADNCDKLFSYATDWIKNNFLGSITSYDITALDIANQDPTVNPILVGDEVKVVHPSIGEKILTAISIDYDLYNPWKTKYKIGSPNNLLNATYGVANKKSGGKKGSGDGITGGGGGGGGGNEPPTQQQIDKQNAEVQYSSKTDFGEDIQLDDALAFLFHDDQGHKYSAKDIKLKFNKNPTLRREFLNLLKDPAFLNNPEFAVQSGLYPNIQAEQQKWRKNVESYLVDDCGLSRDKAEVITNTNEGLTWLANITDDDGNLKPPWNMSPKAAELKKAALRTRQALNGSDKTVTAEPKYGVQGNKFIEDLIGNNLSFDGDNFSYDSESQTFNFGNGKVKMDATAKTVEFDDMEVVRKEVGPSGETRSFGFYDEGNLDGGIMVSKINGDEFEVKIKASKVDLGNYATVGRLEALEVTVNNLLAGRITADKLAANVVVADKIITTVTPEGQDVPVSVNTDLYDFTVDGTKIASFIGTGPINFNIADTETYKAGVSAAGKLTAAWGKVGEDSTLSAKYTVTSGTKESASITVTIPTPSWEGISDGNPGSCTVYADAGGGHRAHAIVLGNLPYNQGKTDGTKSAKAAVTLSELWSGATYTVSNSANSAKKSITLTHNTPSWTTKANTPGVLTYNIYAGGDTRLTVTALGNVPYNQGKSDAESAKYNEGWNDCIEAAKKLDHTCLTGYSTYNNGSAVNLYVAPTGGASIATGQKRVWRYGGSTHTYYGLPDKK